MKVKASDGQFLSHHDGIDSNGGLGRDDHGLFRDSSDDIVCDVELELELELEFKRAGEYPQF